MRNLPLAAVETLVVWATISCCIAAIWPHYKWVALCQVIHNKNFRFRKLPYHAISVIAFKPASEKK